MATPRKPFFNFKNEAGKPVQIVLEGEIGGYWDGTDSSTFRANFARIGENEVVNVHIMSGGGSIFEGNEIANILGAHKGAVTVTLGSICASIATVIMCAGSKVTAAKNSMVMIHDPSVYAGGDSAELRKMADIMDKLKAGIVATYAKKTGKTEEELADAMSEETWMTAEEAKAFGFVNEITGEDATDDQIDNVALTHYKNCTSLFARLQNQMSLGKGDGGSGNGQLLTIRAIKNAAANPPKTEPKPTTVPEPSNKKDTMTPEELAAQDKRIAEGVKAALAKLNTRNQEIRDTVAAVAKRDKKDFSALAAEFISDNTGDKTLDQFLRAMVTSDKFKDTAPVIGSGIEVIDPLAGIKGTPGFQFVNSEGFRALSETIKNRGGGTSKLPVNLSVPVQDFRNVQTSAATSGSGLTSIEKLPGVVELGVRPLTIEDLIMGGQTSNTTIRYIQEVTYTEAAATVAETGTLAELAMTYQEIDATVKDIGGFVKMSENMMADYAAVASFINMRLPYQVDRGVDDQLLTGDGTGTNITGILATAGIQTLALGANTRMDLALKLQTLVRWQNMTAGQAQGGFEPDGYVVHPTDWETLVLTKDANGQYLCKGPFTGAYGQPSEGGQTVGSIVEFYTLWGKKVAISPVVTQGTIVCGAWRMGAQKFDRQGLIIEMTNADGTDFQKRTVTIRGTRRLALAVYRPGCFVQGTGL